MIWTDLHELQLQYTWDCGFLFLVLTAISFRVGFFPFCTQQGTEVMYNPFVYWLWFRVGRSLSFLRYYFSFIYEQHYYLVSVWGIWVLDWDIVGGALLSCLLFSSLLYHTMYLLVSSRHMEVFSGLCLHCIAQRQRIRLCAGFCMGMWGLYGVFSLNFSFFIEDGMEEISALGGGMDGTGMEDLGDFLGTIPYHTELDNFHKY